MIPTPKASQLICILKKGGKRPLWHAVLSPFKASVQEFLRSLHMKDSPNWKGGCGAGNTAENAIKDYQKMFRGAVNSGRLTMKDMTPAINANPIAPVSFVQNRKVLESPGLSAAKAAFKLN